MFWGEGYAQRFLRPYDQKLDSLYRVLIKDPESVRKQQEFLEYFPDNFEDFRKLMDIILNIQKKIRCMLPEKSMCIKD